MRATNSATARLWAAAAVSVVLAMFGAPSAFADSSDLICSNGEVAMDGTCSPPTSVDGTMDSLEIPDGSAGDLSGSSVGDFDTGGAPSEAYLSERGY
jgi:hypothetical protein